jgi:hypothetical protein
MPREFPGVTIAKSGPHAARIAAVSCGEATTPSSPASCAILASVTTCSSSGRRTPTLASVASSMLVRTVTPMTMGRRRPSFPAVSAAARAAACIIGTPPEACTLSIQTPVDDGSFHRLRDRVRDVVKLEVEKDRCAQGHQPPHQIGAFQCEETTADFESASEIAELGGECERPRCRIDVKRD